MNTISGSGDNNRRTVPPEWTSICVERTTNIGVPKNVLPSSERPPALWEHFSCHVNYCITRSGCRTNLPVLGLKFPQRGCAGRDFPVAKFAGDAMCSVFRELSPRCDSPFSILDTGQSRFYGALAGRSLKRLRLISMGFHWTTPLTSG